MNKRRFTIVWALASLLALAVAFTVWHYCGWRGVMTEGLGCFL